jgi:hypothetical protein
MKVRKIVNPAVPARRRNSPNYGVDGRLNKNREIMAKGKCSNCCRRAEDLLKCAGACGGEDMYCNRTCQKADWAMHKKFALAATPLPNL